MRRESANVASHGKDGSEVLDQQRRTTDVAYRASLESVQVNRSIKASDLPFMVCSVCILHLLIGFPRRFIAFALFSA